MEITGTIHHIAPVHNITEIFSKREFVLKIADNPQYPQFVSFQLTQDKCGLIAPFKLGAAVKVFFNLRGRQWVSPQNETKYFNTLEAWRIEPAVIPQHQELPPIATEMSEVQAALNMQAPAFNPSVVQETTEDDLPF